MFRKILVLLCLVVFTIFSERTDAGEIHVSAAASMTDALKEIAAVYRQEYADAALLLNFASSGALARQISAGAPVDLYISANPKWMEHLQQLGVIPPESERALVGNSLVFVGRTARVESLSDLLRLDRVALGSPKSTPVGRYTEQALIQAGLYEKLQDERKIIQAKDVRQALIYADRGEVDGAFVYHTDALLGQHARILFSVPQALYPQVSYPAALTVSGRKNKQADHFFSFLFLQKTQDIFKKYGFIRLEDR